MSQPDTQAQAHPLQSSSPEVRISFLEQIPSMALDSAASAQLADDIFATFTLSYDDRSRYAAQTALVGICAKDPVALAKVDSLASNVADRPFVNPPADILTVLERVNALVSAKELAESVTPSLIYSQARLLERILSEDSADNKRRRLISSALRSTRTALSRYLVLRNGDASLFLDTLLASDKKSVASVVLLSTLAGAAIDSAASAPSASVSVQDRRAEVFNLYTQVILTSKGPLTNGITKSFIPLISDYATVEDFETTLLPAIAKSLLRAPEVVLQLIVPGLFSSLPLIIDLGPFVEKTLLNSLTALFNSSNATVRDLGASTLKLVFTHCHAEDAANRIALSLCASTKKASSPDQRALFGQVLASLSAASNGAAVASALIPSVAKETNEIALGHLSGALFSHLVTALSSENEKLDKSLIDELKKATTNKRLNLRRVYVCKLVENVIDGPKKPWSKSLVEFVDAVKPSLKTAFDEVVANPNASLQSKSLEVGYAYVCLVGDEAGLPLTTTPRIYQKLTTQSEFDWAVRATATFSSSHASEDLGLAWIFYVLSTSIPIESRRLAVENLKSVYAENPSLGVAIANSLTSTDVLEAYPGFQPLLNVFSLPVEKDIREQVLAALVVVCHYTTAVPKNGWAGLCLRAEVDPLSLVTRLYHDMLERIFSLPTGPLYTTGCSAIATLRFIAPEVVTPEVVTRISSGLDLARIDIFSQADLTIWASPEGEVVDVDGAEKPKRVIVENKNSKDYETRKWEQSVREEIEKKKGTSDKVKKLSKEQQAVLNQQSEIRKSVEVVISGYRRAIVLIKTLATQSFDNGENELFPLSVERIVALLMHPSHVLGEEATDCFLSLASRASNTRLDTSIKTLLSVTIVRSIEPTCEKFLGPEFTEEPLKEQVTRVLYRLKSLSDQHTLESNTLVYILPLLLKVLDGKGGIGTKVEEEIEEQILLALDVVSAHSETLSFIPRGHLVGGLLSLMQAKVSTAKQVKECLVSVVQGISTSIDDDETQLLLENAISGDTFARTAVLEIIDAELDISQVPLPEEIWIERFDEEPINSRLATEIWEESGFEVSLDLPEKLLSFLGSEHGSVRLATAKSIASAVASNGPDSFQPIFDKMVDDFVQDAKPPAPVMDKFGIEIKSSKDDKWFPRSGAALTFRELCPFFTSASNIIQFFNFLIAVGLGDSNSTVHQELQAAGLDIVNKHGLSNVEELIKVFEEYLARPDSQTQDQISESVIILYGALARHLKSDDPRLLKIVDRLIITLDTPSEDVQYAVSQCLAPLVKLFVPHLRTYFDRIFEKLLTADKYAVRRGAAYGLSGLVKGAGISSLADFDIIRTLTEAAEDKKDPKRRQGAQFAFECLSQSLGKYFEPYVIELVPIILSGLGDSNSDVREAATYASRTIMKNSTGYGIKRLIPLAVENLDQTAWRAKKGAVELLGTMAYLDPQQLSRSLSVVIPEIVGVLNDSHKEVRNAANQSLQRFGDVIRNPEIQTLVPTLVKAIGNPTKYTDEALDSLLKTKFVHYVDAPSLALIVHVLHRGLKDRSAATKRKACQIVGNMSILTDSKDLTPYLPSLVSELEIAIVDPVPGTRATASKALGSLVEKLGEDQFPDIIPRLMDVLKDESRAGDRLGSAQALSEVIYGLGLAKLDELLPTIIKNCSSPKPWVRQGFMPLLLFLPACFGSSLSPYLNQIIPPILSGLADTSEDIRDVALKAGRRIVRSYATKAVDLLLPELESGLSDSNWRIRVASVELTGDLLFQITGIDTKNLEEDHVASSEINNTLIEVLGNQRRDRILSSLFVCRSDTAALVRTSALEVWKCLVANTPRTVKEILPTLTQVIIKRLASSNEEHRTIAAQTLGDLVRRVGGNALGQLLPTLEQELLSSDSDAKQGICLALIELIHSSSPEVLTEFQATIIGIVRDSLVDTDPEVREAAGQAFDALQESLNDAAGDILPGLIAQVEKGDETALSALKEMMATKSDVVFPALVPTLLAPPLTGFKARSLASIAPAAGSSLFKRLPAIIDVLITGLVENEDDEEISESLDEILLCVVQDEATHILMQHFLTLGKHAQAKRREITFNHMVRFFQESSLDYSAYVNDLLSLLISALNDQDSSVIRAAWLALSGLVKKMSKEQMEQSVKTARQALLLTGSVGVELPGFAIPKGPGCILPIFLQGLMYGTSDQREQSALAIADIVDRTSADNLKPFVTQITGPLIRTIGERYPSGVKAAILFTLNGLLAKIPTFLKPFLPQLQRTFAKSLSDPSSELVRSRAAKALGTLITLQARIDPLVTELISGAKSSSDLGVSTAMLQALYEVIANAGKNLGPASKTGVISFVDEMLPSAAGKETLLTLLAKILSALVDAVDPEAAAKIVKQALHSDQELFSMLVLNGSLKFGTEKIRETGLGPEIAAHFVAKATSEHSHISEAAAIGLGKYLLSLAKAEDEDIKEIISVLAECMARSESRSSDTRRLALVVIRTVSRERRELIEPYLDVIALPLFGCVRDMVIPVKLAAEKAYLTVFQLVEEPGSETFEKWLEQAKANEVVPAQQQRSVQDYTRRVAVRLAEAERGRIAAGGDEEALFSDRIEDVNEIWSVGAVEIANAEN